MTFRKPSDGYRMHARIDGGTLQLLTRTGLDCSHRYSRTIEASSSALWMAALVHSASRREASRLRTPSWPTCGQSLRRTLNSSRDRRWRPRRMQRWRGHILRLRPARLRQFGWHRIDLARQWRHRGWLVRCLWHVVFLNEMPAERRAFLVSGPRSYSSFFWGCSGF